MSEQMPEVVWLHPRTDMWSDVPGGVEYRRADTAVPREDADALADAVEKRRSIILGMQYSGHIRPDPLMVRELHEADNEVADALAAYQEKRGTP